ncbi:hypothetical protein RRG08_061413, partial [Elysia crispata]
QQGTFTRRVLVLSFWTWRHVTCVSSGRTNSGAKFLDMASREMHPFRSTARTQTLTVTCHVINIHPSHDVEG